MADDYEKAIRRGRNAALVAIDNEASGLGNTERLDRFCVGMLSAIGERLEQRMGRLAAAEIIAEFSDAVTLRVRPAEVRRLIRRKPQTRII